jgi:hypothetical protein
LSVTDAKTLGIDVTKYPLRTVCSTGFGGEFCNRYIDCPVKITFGDNESDKFTILYDDNFNNEGFNLLVTPSNITVAEKNLFYGIPSVMGLDILLAYFKLISFDKLKHSFELTTIE